MTLGSTLAVVSRAAPTLTIIPITIHHFSNLPSVTLLIEGKRYQVLFDSGAPFQLRLKQEVLQALTKKTLSDSREIFDVKGNRYVTPSFHVPNIGMEKLTFDYARVAELEERFSQNVHIVRNPENTTPSPQGELGLDAFRNKNLLFDFAHSSLIVCDDKQALKRQGFNLDSMLQIPYEYRNTCIFITAETDMGPLKLIIDSGASLTIVRASIFQEQLCQLDPNGFPTFTTKTFSFGGKDFGPQPFLLLDITPKLSEIDGVLGMDFLLKHQLYIDRKNKVIGIL